MKIKATDQLHVSSVQADSLRPGQEFEVSDAVGKELLKAHPNSLVRLDADEPEEKAAPAPSNKAEPAPANKAAPKPKTKG